LGFARRNKLGLALPPERPDADTGKIDGVRNPIRLVGTNLARETELQKVVIRLHGGDPHPILAP
jgi:hypothetical protein